MGYLVPPHADNEGAAAYLLSDTSFQWVTVRPTNLDNKEEANGKYNVTEKSETPLFGDQTVSRNNVAHFMVELMTDEKTFGKYKHKMPVIVGKEKKEAAATK